jgi:multiple sugar transport system substrate-binding protein
LKRENSVEELELSVMPHGEKTMECLKTLLDQFENQSRIRVHVQMLDWETARAELNKTAIYHYGSDVSEIGTTWIGDFIAMNVFRPFSPADLAKTGGASDFLSSSWRTSHLPHNPQTWAIPWLSDIRVIHYRSDLLQQAGVDENTAFGTHTQLEKTLKCLTEYGVRIPLAFPRTPSRFILHNIASWVWNEGGDFCSPDGKQVLFDQPKALKGMRQFFSLLRFMTPEGLQLMDEVWSWELFRRGDTAIHIDPIRSSFPIADAEPAVISNWKMAPLPGISFVGGTSLAVWKHTRREASSIELVRFLTSAPSQLYYAQASDQLPTRLSVLATPEYASNIHIKSITLALANGRSYPSAALWGLIEDKLTNALLKVWAEVMAKPDTDIDAVLNENLGSLAKRLNITLQN